MDRLIFVLWLTLVIRTSAMAELRVDQFMFTTQNGHQCIVFTEHVGSAKTNKGGIATFGRKPVQIYIFDLNYLSSVLFNPFDTILAYLALRRKHGVTSPSFFSGDEES